MAFVTGFVHFKGTSVSPLTPLRFVGGAHFVKQGTVIVTDAWVVYPFPLAVKV